MQKNLKLLYRSFEQELTEKEQLALLKALEDVPELREKKSRIERLRLKLSGSRSPKGRPFFRERVMSQISSASETVLEPFWDALFHRLFD